MKKLLNRLRKSDNPAAAAAEKPRHRTRLSAVCNVWPKPKRRPRNPRAPQQPFLEICLNVRQVKCRHQVAQFLTGGDVADVHTFDPDVLEIQ